MSGARATPRLEDLVDAARIAIAQDFAGRGQRLWADDSPEVLAGVAADAIAPLLEQLLPADR